MKTDKRGVIYLAAPYSSPDSYVEWSRYKKTCSAAARMMAEGIAVFSPLANTIPAVHLGGLDIDHAAFLRIDKTILARCDELLILALDGWRQSRGVQQEAAEAIRLHLPIILVKENEIDALPVLSKDSCFYKQSTILSYGT